MVGFEMFQDQMRGYFVDSSYESQEAFFKSYMRDRWREIHPSLIKFLPFKGHILSVSSGRAINELFLIENGYNISCSDLDFPECLDATRKIFKDIRYEKIDVLGNDMKGNYDAVLCIGLIYNFDMNQLDKFFTNVAKVLNDGGVLVLDYAGSADNVWTRIFHTIYLPVESWFYALFLIVKNRQIYSVGKVFHGYRHSNEDIEGIARKHGLVLKEYEERGELLDFLRSPILKRLMRFNVIKRLLLPIGQRMPYLRMGKFMKI